MRILVVGPTGRTGRHVIASLRAKRPDVSLRGACRNPQTLARSIEVIPGNVGGARTLSRTIEVIPENTGDAQPLALARTIEVIPENTGDAQPLAFARTIEVIPENTGDANADAGGLEIVAGDLEAAETCASAVEGVDVVIHYAPAFHPREAALGIGLIDAAVAAGVRRFVYVSAQDSRFDQLPGSAAKRAVEAHLAASGLEWTVLRPQRYMQNIDVEAAADLGSLAVPAAAGTRLPLIDLADVAEAVATVALDESHASAAYDLASEEALSGAEMAAVVASVAGKPVEAVETRAGDAAPLWAGDLPQLQALELLEQVHAHNGTPAARGNANVLRWLLGRDPETFEGYVRRVLGA